MLQSTQVRRQADRVARGAAQKTVNLSELNDFFISLPPLSEQRAFTRRLQQVDRLKGPHLKSQVGLGLLFNSLNINSTDIPDERKQQLVASIDAMDLFQ